MSVSQSPVLIIVVPLLTALLIGIVGLFKRKLCYPIALVAMAVSLYGSICTLYSVMRSGVIHYRLGGWMPPFGIEYVIDHLNGLVLVIVSFSGLINLVYSKKSVEQEHTDKIPQFYILYLLLITGLLGITITGDVFNLYVLLEITALTAYALIALGRDRAILSSFNYLIIGTIGASFYLLGVGHLYIATGSLNMADLHIILSSIYGNQAVLVAFILIIVGVWTKMAFFPVHGWLPNAYTYAPSAVSSVIAPTMTKVMVYVMIRIMFSVFSTEFLSIHIIWQDVVVWCAVIAIIGGALQALMQRDFKKMLTYLLISEVGYMVGGVWLVNSVGITGAILHILNDAMMMLALFFVAGIIEFKIGSTSFENLTGLFRKMPITMGAFVVAALSMIGVPPTCGFFSKWYLILGAIDAGKWHFMIALLFSSLVNVVLFFRVIEIGYFKFAVAGNDHTSDKSEINEAPISMLIPLLIVAVILILIGIYSREIVSNIIQHAVPVGIGS